jgi:predicted extracellular nuclease
MKLKHPALLALLLSAPSVFAQVPSVVINEVDADTPGTDSAEFVELYDGGSGNTDLTGLTVVFYNGSNNLSYLSSKLDGLKTNNAGYFVLCGDVSKVENCDLDVGANTNLIQNGQDAIALYSGEALSFPSNSAVTTDNLIDAIVYDTDDSDDAALLVLLNAGQPQVDEDGSDGKDTESNQRCANGSGGARNTRTYQQHLATPGAENVCGADEAPFITSIVPLNGESNVAIDANINVTFNEDVVIAGYNAIVCENEASITVTATGEGDSYVLNPDQDFVSGDSCSFTISATDVTDLDGEPDNLAEDITVTFSVVDTSVVVELVINEFLADPASGINGDANGDGTRDSGQDEFVELVNFGNSDLDLSGWTLSDAVQLRHTFPEGSIVEAGCAAVVFGGGAPQGAFGGALVQTASAGSVGFNNGGDTITMTNGVSTFEVVYGSEGGNNQSLTLNPDVTGEAYSAHSSVEASSGALFSPGTKLDGTKFAGCTIPDIAPTVVDITPADGATEVGVDSVISLSFSEEVTVSQWPNLVCELSGEMSLNGALSGTEFTLTPATEFENVDTCTFTVPAASVADVDGTPDMMASDFVSSFNTAALLSVMPIHEVQGSGNASNLIGQTVLVQAIVTAVLPDSNVFYVQEEDVDTDVNPATSEGILVFTDGAFDMPAVGDLVEARGLVSELFNRTQITLSSAPSIIAEDSVLPSAATLTLPVASLDELEALEGMLVTSSGALIVTDVFTLGRFGQAVLSSKRLYIPTNIFTPGSVEAIALEQSNSLDRVLLDDGNDSQNPEVVPFPTSGLSASNTLRLGDTIALLTGVVDFAFGDYRIIPTQDPTFVATNPRTAEPDLNLGNLKVASLNVLNYFNNIDDSGSVCGPTASSSCRGADSDLEFERQKAKTVAAIVAMDADIMGLMEIENNGFSEGSAIVDLVAGINAVMGAGTYSIVDPGAAIGTDAITVAFMYKPSVVSLAGAPQILDSSNSISDEDGVLFNDGKNRPSLVQEFALLENGETLVISVNHLKSKGSGCGAGDDDTTTGQGSCNLTRTRAAKALSAFLDAQYPDTATLIIGDLNAYAKEDPISALEGEGYTNLVNYFGGAEAYSYSFRGLLGYLDHALANEEALAKVVDVTEWHINADEPISLDYNVEFKAPANVTGYYADDAYRMSDHDPVLIALQLDSASVIGDWDVDGDVDMNDLRSLIRAIQLRQEIDSSFDFDNDGRVTYNDVRLLQRMCTRARCAV